MEEGGLGKVKGELRPGRWTVVDGSQGIIMKKQWRGVRGAKPKGRRRDESAIRCDHVLESTSRIVREIHVGNVLEKLGTVALPVRWCAGGVADVNLVKPLVTICIVGDTTEVVQTDHSGGEVL